MSKTTPEESRKFTISDTVFADIVGALIAIFGPRLISFRASRKPGGPWELYWRFRNTDNPKSKQSPWITRIEVYHNHVTSLWERHDVDLSFFWMISLEDLIHDTSDSWLKSVAFAVPSPKLIKDQRAEIARHKAGGE